jgi:hypothetical protein
VGSLYLTSRSCYFLPYVEGAKQFDFCFSFRYHGSVVPVTAEVPAVLVVVDGRMKDFALIAHYRHISIFSDHFESAEENIFKWLQKIPFDGEAFDTNRRDIAIKYYRMLSPYNVSLNPNIMNLIHS